MRAACDACNARHAPPSPSRCERDSPFAIPRWKEGLERREGRFEPEGPSDRTGSSVPFDGRGGWIPGDEAHVCDAIRGREETNEIAGGVPHAAGMLGSRQKATDARSGCAPGHFTTGHNRWGPEGLPSSGVSPSRSHPQEGSDRHRYLFREDIDSFSSDGTGSTPFDRGSISLSIGNEVPFGLERFPPFPSFRNEGERTGSSPPFVAGAAQDLDPNQDRYR